jgi:hypothetical protein
MSDGTAAYRPSLADVRGVRQMEISERSIAARRCGRGQVRMPSKFGAASKARTLNENDRRSVENDFREKGKL